MKTVLLTGGAGAIGVHVISHLMRNTDWNVVCLDSFRHKGDPARLTSIFSTNPEWKQRVRIIQHDICCPLSAALVSAIGPVSYILHLAAMSDVSFSIDNPVFTIKNNIDSTLTMLEYAEHVDHEAFIYFSTDEVYGPVKRGDAHPEWATHRPSNAYSASKAASEDICYAYWRSGKVKLIITNTMNNFGEMQGPSKFPSMVVRKLNSGEPVEIHCSGDEIGTRFYIHSEDTADALLFILNRFSPPHAHKVGEIDDPDRYHIVGSACVDNLDLAERIADIAGARLDAVRVDFHRDNPAHDIHYGLQDNKLRRSGWTERLGFENGLKRTVEWEMSNQ
jgi:dTDP-glucose 4,6-dehydratase